MMYEMEMGGLFEMGILFGRLIDWLDWVRQVWED